MQVRTRAALTVVVALLVFAPFAVAAGSPVPAPLLGTWKRDGYTMVVKPNGLVSVVDFTATFAGQPGHRLQIGNVPVCYPRHGVYTWKVTHSSLTLTKVTDSCAAAVNLFSGVWKRK